jgi:hypothetical protein
MVHHGSNSIVTQLNLFSAQHSIVIPAQAGLHFDFASDVLKTEQNQDGSRPAPG